MPSLHFNRTGNSTLPYRKVTHQPYKNHIDFSKVKKECEVIQTEKDKI